jgi:DNA-binding HxlR family transcriptional regulator
VDRSYGQYCATARTLDIIGERWTLLLIRELLTGPRRFKDLLSNLPGLSTGLLTARLKRLEHYDIARKTLLPPPASTPAYALTPAGKELEPVVLALATWGMKHLMDAPGDDEVFEPSWAVLGMRACFDAQAATGVRASYEFRVDDDRFHADIDDGTINVAAGPAHQPDAVISTDRVTFRDIASGHTTLPDALRANTATATGDRALLRELARLFRLPDRARASS